MPPSWVRSASCADKSKALAKGRSLFIKLLSNKSLIGEIGNYRVDAGPYSWRVDFQAAPPRI